jgi:predicted dehydrogenase
VKRIKIGLIGCGKQAVKHIASLKTIPNVDLSLSDIENDLAQSLAKKEGLDWRRTPDELFEDNNIDAVVICTPTQSHTSLIKEAIAAKKDVFCEKPLCESVIEAAELSNIVADSGRMVMVGYIYRFVPIFEEGYEIFRARQINDESFIMGCPQTAFFRLGGRGGHQLWKHQKASGGGAINEMLVHMLDLANWYFGPFRDIEVLSCALRSPTRAINGEKVQVDAEDFILTRCYGVNGTEIYCQADLITPAFSQYVEVQSENGTFMGSIQADMPSYVFLKESRGGYDEGKTILKFGQRNLFDIQMMAFVQWVLRKELQDRNTVHESVELMEVMDEIRKQVAGLT